MLIKRTTSNTMKLIIITLLACLFITSVYSKGNYICKSFNIESGCDGKYICTNGYANCAVNIENDVECDCYIKVHRGPF